MPVSFYHLRQILHLRRGAFRIGEYGIHLDQGAGGQFAHANDGAGGQVARRFD